MTQKTCSKCKQLKLNTEFNKATKYKSGLASQCRICSKLYYQRHKESLSIKYKIYRENNKEQKKVADNNYRAKNKEKIKQQVKNYYLANKEKILSYYKSWKISDVGIASRKSSHHKRKALMKKINGSYTKDEILLLFEQQKSQCIYCKTKLNKSGSNKYHIDHIIPLSKGGDNNIINIQLLCPTCNLQKHDSLPEDFARKFNMLI